MKTLTTGDLLGLWRRLFLARGPAKATRLHEILGDCVERLDSDDPTSAFIVDVSEPLLIRISDLRSRAVQEQITSLRRAGWLKTWRRAARGRSAAYEIGIPESIDDDVIEAALTRPPGMWEILIDRTPAPNCGCRPIARINARSKTTSTHIRGGSCRNVETPAFKRGRSPGRMETPLAALAAAADRRAWLRERPNWRDMDLVAQGATRDEITWLRGRQQAGERVTTELVASADTGRNDEAVAG